MWDVEWLTATNRSFVFLPYSTQLWRMKFSGYIIWNSLSFFILPTSTHIVTIFPFLLHYFNYYESSLTFSPTFSDWNALRWLDALPPFKGEIRQSSKKFPLRYLTNFSSPVTKPSCSVQLLSLKGLWAKQLSPRWVHYAPKGTIYVDIELGFRIIALFPLLS